MYFHNIKSFYLCTRFFLGANIRDNNTAWLIYIKFKSFFFNHRFCLKCTVLSNFILFVIYQISGIIYTFHFKYNMLS